MAGKPTLVDALIALEKMQDDAEAARQAELVVQQAVIARGGKGGR